MLKSTYKWLFLTVLLLGLFIPAHIVAAQTAAPVQVGFYQNYKVAPSAVIQVPIEVTNVKDLYALEINIEFDETMLSIEDADPSRPGVQIALGNFLDPGMILYNDVNNSTGSIHFVMTQANPSTPKSGNGILLVLNIKGLKEGTSKLTITYMQLATRDGIEIASTNLNCEVKVDKNATIVTGTQIPVQDPGGLQIIPTEVPTTQAQATQFAATQTASALVPVSGITPQIPTAVNTKQVSAQGKNDGSLEGKWWILLILGLLVVVMAFAWWLTRKKF